MVPPPLDESSSREQPVCTWGWLPALSLTAALGLLLVALGDTAAREALADAQLVFWCGLVLLIAPVTLRLALCSTPGHERLGLVVLLGLSLYLVKLLHSPFSFTFVDEFMHVRTAEDILRTHHLFRANSLLPVSPLYPSLEIVTTALVSLSGLSIFTAGVLVLAAGRLILLCSLFLFYRQVSNSTPTAGLATLIYMTNPSFVFFDSQFGYESLALPFTLLLLFAVARRACAASHEQIGLTVVIALTTWMVVTTHHLTSYALVAFLLLWTLTAALVGRGRSMERSIGPGPTALLALWMTLVWLAYVATLTVGYLAPNFISGIRELIQLIAGEEGPRQLFHSSNTGYVAPRWERFMGTASVAFILLVLPVGLLAVWRQYRANAPAVTLALAALTYPVTLALRFTSTGAEISGRASEFLFVPIAFVAAVGIVHLGLLRLTITWRPFLVVVWATVIFMGGVIVNWPPWDRLPGPYLLLADSRSIEPQGIAAALWARSYVGPDQRVAADRTNSLLMGSYGEQYVVTHLANGVDESIVFTSLRIGPSELDMLQRGLVHYLVVDQRLSMGVPQGGDFFEYQQNGDTRHPISPAALAKFDHYRTISRLFDSGSIVIYDVGSVSYEP